MDCAQRCQHNCVACALCQLIPVYKYPMFNRHHPKIMSHTHARPPYTTTSHVDLQASAFSADAARAARDRAQAFVDRMDSGKVWPQGVLLEASLTAVGASTELQSERLFRKCVTPGATIRVGVLGGSISSPDRASPGGDSYSIRFAQRLQTMCSEAKVVTFNGARNATGSQTLGACASTAMGDTKALDIVLMEFTLNDTARCVSSRACGPSPCM